MLGQDDWKKGRDRVKGEGFPRAFAVEDPDGFKINISTER